GWPMFGVQLELHHRDQKITAYRQDRIVILPSEGMPARKVLPAAQAVANLIEKYLPFGAVIREIRLGYHGHIFDETETQVTAPTWRVLLDDGEIYYIHAISGEVSAKKGARAAADGSPQPLTAGAKGLKNKVARKTGTINSAGRRTAETSWGEKPEENMSLSFTILASGSTGNAAVVASKEAAVLVDAGLSLRKIEALMAERNLSGADIDAVLVTHEHTDHIRGLGAFVRKYNVPVYANEKTLGALRRELADLD